MAKGGRRGGGTTSSELPRKQMNRGVYKRRGAAGETTVGLLDWGQAPFLAPGGSASEQHHCLENGSASARHAFDRSGRAERNQSDTQGERDDLRRLMRAGFWTARRVEGNSFRSVISGLCVTLLLSGSEVERERENGGRFGPG